MGSMQFACGIAIAHHVLEEFAKMLFYPEKE